MAASLGRLAHDTCYAAAYPPPAAASYSYSYFPSPPLPDLVAEFPPPPADDYFLREMVGGARAPAGCGGYDYCGSAPVFANGASDAGGAAADNGIMSLLSYGGGVYGDGTRPMSGPAGGTGGNGVGGRRPPSRIGFRTRSEVDVLDDGFKWRKYGKKAVKSSPNLRNYYRCSSEGCGVKKRVERDSDDPRYVVTTYDGVHNHAAPGAAAAAYLCQPPPPPRGATTPTTPCFSPPCSASSSAPLVPAPSWSAAFDAWEAQLHAAAAAAAAAAHSSESSY